MLSPETLAVPFSAAALALAVSGVAKLRRPGPLVRTLAAAGIPAGPVAVRLFAVGEAVLGAWCLASPSGASALVLASLYVGFAGFLAFLILGPAEVASCGCAGERDLPPSWVHVGLNLAAAASGLASAVNGPTSPGLARSLRGLPLGGAGLLVGVAALTWLALLCVAYLPGALTAYRGRT